MPGRIAALGEATRVAGYRLAGVLTVPVGTPEQTRAAWAALPADVVLVVLTAEAAEALGDDLARPATDRLVAVMPP
jgi:vacuolar-type H+-ATPase subunit F/Vma7